MSELKLTGIIHKLFELTKVSESFMKQEFVVVTDEQYPQHVKFECTQARTDILQKVKEGDNVTVHFNVRGRAWDNKQGETKYFVSLNAWRIETGAASNEAVIEDMETDNTGTDSFSDNLPF